MKAIRVHLARGPSLEPYSAINPAPSSALTLDTGAEIPSPSQAGEILIRNHASTVIRDELRWEQTYDDKNRLPGYPIPGRDVAGTVVTTCGTSAFRPGDEVYGMTSALRASMWADYVLALDSEVAAKPRNSTWAEAAAVPLSALTACQGLFEVAGLAEPDFQSRAETKHQQMRDEHQQHVLITGAAGGAGTYLVQLAALAEAHVTAATSSNSRNAAPLYKLGVDKVVEYSDLGDASFASSFDVIIDAVGGQVLESSWSLIKETGILLSLDFGSYGFVERHRKLHFTDGKEKVRASWFLVHPSGEQLERIRKAIELGLLTGHVAEGFPLAEAAKAYEVGNGKVRKIGKVVLSI